MPAGIAFSVPPFSGGQVQPETAAGVSGALRTWLGSWKCLWLCCGNQLGFITLIKPVAVALGFARLAELLERIIDRTETCSSRGTGLCWEVLVGTEGCRDSAGFCRDPVPVAILQKLFSSCIYAEKWWSLLSYGKGLWGWGLCCWACTQPLSGAWASTAIVVIIVYEAVTVAVLLISDQQRHLSLDTGISSRVFGDLNDYRQHKSYFFRKLKFSGAVLNWVPFLFRRKKMQSLTLLFFLYHLCVLEGIQVQESESWADLPAYEVQMRHRLCHQQCLLVSSCGLKSEWKELRVKWSLTHIYIG